jgi:hypothetical protein
MDERFRVITHRGKEIMLVDVSHCEPQEILAILPDVQDEIAQRPENSVLTLADFTGAHVDKNVATRIKELLVFDRPYVKRSAWVGVESLPHVFYENFKTFSQREFPTFKTRDEAMEWLVTDQSAA